MSKYTRVPNIKYHFVQKPLSGYRHTHRHTGSIWTRTTKIVGNKNARNTIRTSVGCLYARIHLLANVKPRPHQQQCRSNIVECYKSNDSFDKVETNWTCSICFDFVEKTKFYDKRIRHCCLLHQHCCWYRRGFSRFTVPSVNKRGNPVAGARRHASANDDCNKPDHSPLTRKSTDACSAAVCCDRCITKLYPTKRSQHSQQERLDLRQQCCCASWPWPLTVWLPE